MRRRARSAAVLKAEGGGEMKWTVDTDSIICHIKILLIVFFSVLILILCPNKSFSQEKIIYRCTSNNNDLIDVVYNKNNEYIVTTKDGSKFNILPGIVHGYGNCTIKKNHLSKPKKYEIVVFQDYDSASNSFFGLYTYYDDCGAISISKDDRGYALTILQSWAPLGDRVISGRCEKIE